MASQQTQPARGMRDFLPEDVRRREYVIGVVRRVYQRYGFEPLETPALENIETLTGKYGEEGNQLIFKVLRRGEHESSGETDLALRYDLTVPLARVVAEYRGKLPKFFKRYQIQPVWRADRPARGRFREFFQCDVDAIGSTSTVVEVGAVRRGQRRAARAGFDDFVIRLNHRELLRGMLDTVGVPATLHDQALVALDKLDKIGADGVRKRTGRARHRRTRRRIRLLGAFERLGAGGDLARRSTRKACVARASTSARQAEGIAGVDTLTEICGSPARRAPRRTDCRPQPGARPVVLHRRHHGSRGSGPRSAAWAAAAVTTALIGMFSARRFRRAGFRSGSSGSSS